MSNKTPFEIRMELLAMAKEMLIQVYETERDAIFHMWHLECEKSMESKSEIPPVPPMPEYPTPQKIIEKASELNSFISKG